MPQSQRFLNNFNIEAIFIGAHMPNYIPYNWVG